MRGSSTKAIQAVAGDKRHATAQWSMPLSSTAKDVAIRLRMAGTQVPGAMLEPGSATQGKTGGREKAKGPEPFDSGPFYWRGVRDLNPWTRGPKPATAHAFREIASKSGHFESTGEAPVVPPVPRSLLQFWRHSGDGTRRRRRAPALGALSCVMRISCIIFSFAGS